MTTPSAKISIGVSACLLGDPVRFNGGHKKSQWCTEVLAQHFDLVPLCPEVAIGLGAPRPTIRLQGLPQAPRAVMSSPAEIDVTDALYSYGQLVAEQQTDVCGYIFMQQSPSCGVHKVKVYPSAGDHVVRTGRGAFTRALMLERPEVPVEEDGRLHDPVLRENFITRVYAYAQWQQLLRSGLTMDALYRFHARYKYQLLASSRMDYQFLGQLLAQRSIEPLDSLAKRYFRNFMQALSKPASRGTHCNVLQHLAGYLKRHLGVEDKQEIQQAITAYRLGEVPLVVPMSLLKHHFRHYPHSYIAEQAYLQPHPEQMGLRNAI